jgi:acyl phosphate:glycerol-3-phosphate acyltransferase
MQILTVLAILVIAYLLGSIPFGWVIVKLTTGRDIRQIESGRTGGTNVWRSAGFLAGLATAILDILKGTATVWITRSILPADYVYLPWVEVTAPLLAVLGHNYSIYMLERRADTGKLHLRGGAGGAPCYGGAIGLWPPIGLIIFPIGLVIYFGVGYASLTTLSVGVSAAVIFTITALQGILPWQYILYGVGSTILIAWSLRPNLARLRAGTERLHGIRVWLKKKE